MPAFPHLQFEILALPRLELEVLALPRLELPHHRFGMLASLWLQVSRQSEFHYLELGMVAFPRLEVDWLLQFGMRVSRMGFLCVSESGVLVCIYPKGNRPIYKTFQNNTRCLLLTRHLQLGIRHLQLDGFESPQFQVLVLLQRDVLAFGSGFGFPEPEVLELPRVESFRPWVSHHRLTFAHHQFEMSVFRHLRLGILAFPQFAVPVFPGLEVAFS
ncbi:hypothetical protein QVD99_001667 [Batrachochytrium dendrobatidis]|nr:hypothetical protein QVD99_001667 [Batrachochytrium dendrobatidis]